MYHIKPIVFKTLLLFIIPFIGIGQKITHGPVVGGVTESGARVYVRTVAPMSGKLVLENGDWKGEWLFDTKPERDNSMIVDVDGLKSNTLYAIKFYFESERPDSLQGSFTTFPKPGEPGNYVFVTGSCQESENMRTFDRMAELKPRMMIHTGDFTYPSYQMGDEYPFTYEAVQESFRRRYQEKRMKEMLRTVPIAYIADDDDGWGCAREEGSAGVSIEMQQRGKKKKKVVVNKLHTTKFSQLERSNCKRGYVENFPGYALVDSSDGFYHSFVMGNCEFIFLDTRFTADLNYRNFKYDSLKNHWSFAPDSNVRLISKKQMDWAKQKLKESKADWKFLVCGLPFNQNLKHLIDLGIKTQDIIAGDAGEKGTGLRIASSFSQYWAGFPYQSNELLAFLKNNQIKDVIVISGDTHHNVMDDGTNGGLPEINASGLAVAGTHLAYYMNKFCKLMGYPRYDKFVWNHGGGGLKGNKNFKNQFGKVEVMGKEKVRLSVVDESNVTLAVMDITHSSINKLKAKKPAYFRKLERRYRNPKPTAWIKFAKWMARIIFKQS
ncbi:MAG: alkaline phosphatase D family protein [Bacteroidia bacterium]|nr:alkaline phosphatase D family protein [Bacteroidia bacterium]